MMMPNETGRLTIRISTARSIPVTRIGPRNLSTPAPNRPLERPRRSPARLIEAKPLSAAPRSLRAVGLDPAIHAQAATTTPTSARAAIVELSSEVSMSNIDSAAAVVMIDGLTAPMKNPRPIPRPAEKRRKTSANPRLVQSTARGGSRASSTPTTRSPSTIHGSQNPELTATW